MGFEASAVPISPSAATSMWVPYTIRLRLSGAVADIANALSTPVRPAKGMPPSPPRAIGEPPYRSTTLPTSPGRSNGHVLDRTVVLAASNPNSFKLSNTLAATSLTGSASASGTAEMGGGGEGAAAAAAERRKARRIVSGPWFGKGAASCHGADSINL